MIDNATIGKIFRWKTDAVRKGYLEVNSKSYCYVREKWINERSRLVEFTIQGREGVYGKKENEAEVRHDEHV